MLKLHVLQAEFGDCLLLEFGAAAAPRFILIDGGPPAVYEGHLKSVLKGLARSGHRLDLVVLSHVDTDHITGLLDYFAELRTQPADRRTLPAAAGLWHNSFSRTIGRNNDIQARFQRLMTASRCQVMSHTGIAVNGIAEGNRLGNFARMLGIPVNERFPDDVITTDTAPDEIPVGNLQIRVVGPAPASLAELEREWQAWLDDNEEAIGRDDPQAMANSDRSVPNLSSIMLLVQGHGKTILLTGDGRGDHLLQGLGQAGLLDQQGKLHVDVLKLAHHGSNRNVTRTFFQKITADTYVASANGRDGNPDLETLNWIVETAQAQQRRIKIVATNRTPSIRQLLSEHPPREYGYQMDVLAARRHAKTLELAA